MHKRVITFLLAACFLAPTTVWASRTCCVLPATTVRLQLNQPSCCPSACAVHEQSCAMDVQASRVMIAPTAAHAVAHVLATTTWFRSADAPVRRMLLSSAVSPPASVSPAFSLPLRL